MTRLVNMQIRSVHGTTTVDTDITSLARAQRTHGTSSCKVTTLANRDVLRKYHGQWQEERWDFNLVVLVHVAWPTSRAMPDAPRDVLYAQIQRRMMSSGDWDRISEALASKLNENGWVDSLHDSSKETARADESVSVRKLLENFRSQPASLVPPKLKDEIVQLIRQYLDTQLDK
ncbi:hypothetical protein EUX98_g4833 [Antrodiella citrinella]|uniref:Transcription and mRNA export factor SUS1 n=1 Tax=Antrodiella citrinella TaxID=2447956 RepID=A0A4S4MUT8_9APHY|nr:hypothetical protein EUX98_g4833 [Antrodiella citrinella]